MCGLAINAAPKFGATREAILSAERTQPVSDARAVACPMPATAERVTRDHGSVRRYSYTPHRRTPTVADTAARVSEHINSRYTARGPGSRPATMSVLS